MISEKKLKELANTIRTLSAEGVQSANSGHPGLPMGCADIASVLWQYFLKHNPKNSQWLNRDRFVLSAGHGSMLIYSLLHLYGYDISIDDLKNFRQLHSRTPGHPEYSYTDGVETTTGPLGQGFANAVGMALSSKILAEKFNTSSHKVVDNKIYALCGDGCMMEGVCKESASLAGHLGLNNLIAIYDSNKITIEGSTDLAFTENVAKRFEAYNWEVVFADGHSFQSINQALEKSRKSEKPFLIVAQTVIGKGSPNKSGTHKVHGSPLGQEEVNLTRQSLLDGGEAFTYSSSVTEFTQEKIFQGQQDEQSWENIFNAWSLENSELRKQWDTFHSNEKIDLDLPEFEAGSLVASRKSSSQVLNHIAKQIPNLYGGSADLDCSNLSRMEEEGDINTKSFQGKNLHFGVREHGMGAICNGMVLYGGLKVYCATFLVFSDYMRGAIRLAAIMKQPIIYIFTHDSIFVGEDGPTHQPIEHKAVLDAIPNLSVIRPGDANEVAQAWKCAINRTDGPTALLLSRQNIRTLKETQFAPVSKGAYILKKESKPNVDLILFATGSELELAYDAAQQLEAKGKSIRVVSFPSVDLFEKQSIEYKESTFPDIVRKRFALDYGIAQTWHKYLGLDGKALTIETFGESAPGAKVAEHFGFTVNNIVTEITKYLDA